MGLGRALLFGSLGAVPGLILAVIGWAISGGSEEWGAEMYLACYIPVFGCIAAGIIIGWREEIPGVED